MPSINRVTLLGNLGRDPELKYTKNGTAVCNASIATQKYFKKDDEWKKSEPVWHKVVAWRKLAELLGTAAKGGLVFIEGELTQRKWEDREGKVHYVTEVLASVVVVIGKEQPQSRSQESDEGAEGMDPGPGTDDDVPF